MKTENKLIGSSIVAAIAASFCCITPVLAFIAGASGFAASFKWIEPFRPYLIILTVLVLGFAWFHKLKPVKKTLNCDCDDEKKSRFINSKQFLFFVTIFAFAMLAFPYYAHNFYPSRDAQHIIVEQSNSKELSFNIKGMTCQGCEKHIENEVLQLKGIVNVKANHITATAIVTYDVTKVTKKEIEDAVEQTGYKIIK